MMNGRENKNTVTQNRSAYLDDVSSDQGDTETEMSRDDVMTSLEGHDHKPPWSRDNNQEEQESQDRSHSVTSPASERTHDTMTSHISDNVVDKAILSQHSVTLTEPETSTKEKKPSSDNHQSVSFKNTVMYISGNTAEGDMTSLDRDDHVTSQSGHVISESGGVTSQNSIVTSENGDVTSESGDVTPAAPDGGWGWVIVMGSGLAFFLSGGLSRSFTLLFQQLLVVFDQSAAATSTTAAIFGAVKMCSSPLVSMMCSKFTKRTVAVSGGLLMGAALILTSFPVSLPYLYVTYGVLAAFGMNMTMTPTFVIVGQYFRKRRARAMSLAMVGGSLGGMILPPLITFLFGRYGYSGTLLILAGLMFNLCVAGAVFRPLEKKGKPSKYSRTPLETEEECTHLEPNNEDNDDMDELDEPPPQTKRQVSFQIKAVQHSPKEKHKRSTNKWSRLYKSTGLHLFRLPRFVFYSLLMLGSVLSLSISGTFLSGVVRDLGLDDTHTGMLLSISAIMDIPSKFASGFLFDLKKIRPYRSLLLCCLGFLTSGCVLGIGFASSFVELVVVYLLYTFFASAYHTQHATVLADIVGSQNLSGAMGMCRLFQGIGFTIGPTVGGHLKDKTGEYRMAYVFAAVVLLVFTVAYAIVDVRFLWQLRRKRERERSRHFPEGHIARFRHDSISAVE